MGSRYDNNQPRGQAAQETAEGLSSPTSPDELLSATAAARRLGIVPNTLYDWLGRSDRGLLVIRGRNVTIDYLQGGPGGQGRIGIEASEINRIRNLMRVRPQSALHRRKPMPDRSYPGIDVPLGRPDDFPVH